MPYAQVSPLLRGVMARDTPASNAQLWTYTRPQGAKLVDGRFALEIVEMARKPAFQSPFERPECQYLCGFWGRLVGPLLELLLGPNAELVQLGGD